MLKEMKYVYTVYQEGSFSNAAEKLFLSQPVVSSMVKRAEEEFNAKIFDRTTRPVSLTAEGEIYIHAIESIQKIESEILSMYSTKKESIAETRGKAGVCVFSPGIDPCGNSVRGMKSLTYLSDKLDLRSM